MGTLALTLLKVPQPLQVGSVPGWTSIAAGARHTAAIRADSTLWLWGANDYGQLGEPLRSTNYYRFLPTQLAAGQKWIQVVCGQNCTLAIRADGTLWAWGANGRSQLGLGAQAASVSSFFTPQQVGRATNWARLALGATHALGLRTDGTLWAWGNNTYGQIGNGTSGNTLYDDVKDPVQIGTATTWSRIAACSASSLALRTDGTLWSWGSNGVGQLGVGTTNSRPVPAQVGTATWASLAAGSDHVLAVQRNGTLWGWGYNLAGEVGDGSTTNRLSPVQVGNLATWTTVAAGVAHSLALRADGTAWEWGIRTYFLDINNPPIPISRPVPVPGPVANWATVAGGYAHSVALRTDGTLWAWGNNGASQLGNPIFTDLPVLLPLLTSPLAVRRHAASSGALSVFPNPSHGKTTITGASSFQPVIISDLLGREVKQLPAGSLLEFSVVGLGPGFYFVRQGSQSAQLVVE